VSETPAFHVHGKMSRSKGQIRSNFAALLLWPSVSQKTQTSKPIELKFGVKHEIGQVLHAKFSHDRRSGGYQSAQVTNFVKKMRSYRRFLSLRSARLCTDHAEIWYETVLYTVGILSHAKFEPNR